MNALVVDGTESVTGRGLLLLSALYGCTDRLAGLTIRVCDVARPDVILAWQVFHAETGLRIDLRRQSAERVLAGAVLYAAIAAGDAGHLRLREAAQAGVPTLVAVQFPDAARPPDPAHRIDAAAFDTRRFAAELRDALARRLEPAG